MKNETRPFHWLVSLGSALVMTCGAGAVPAHAARVNVVHGIDGRDLGAQQALPVDIAVNGTCSLKGVTFTQQAAVELGVGTYRVTVHPSNGSCSNTAVIDKTITIATGDELKRFTAVASLSAATAPQLALFETVPFGPRVGIRHLAVAGAVGVELSLTDYGRFGKPVKARIRNGGGAESYGVFARKARYRVDIRVGAKRISRLEGTVSGGQRNFLIVGSAQNGLTIISEDVRYK